MPYSWFAIASISLFIAALRRTSRTTQLFPSLALFLAAATYYAGFLIISPGFEWRYFLPSFVLLVLSAGASWQRILLREPATVPRERSPQPTSSHARA